MSQMELREDPNPRELQLAPGLRVIKLCKLMKYTGARDITVPPTDIRFWF